MLARALLLGLLALASISSQAWATGPAYYPPGGSGSGVVANTCSAGDFFSAVDAGGNFTCSTPSGSGDVTAVGDCASGDCFSGSTGSTLTAAPAGHFVLKSSNSMYFDADIAAGSTGNAFVFRSNNTALTLARIVEDGYADLRSGLDLRLYDTDDSNYVEIAAPALGSNVSLTLPTSGGTIPSSATSPLALSAAGALSIGDVADCTNQFVTGAAANLVLACSTATLAGAQFANQGTTTTVLHGNASGNPSWGGVVSADITDGTIANADVNSSAAILFSKLATTNTDKLLGRDTAGGGAVEEIGLTSPLAFTGASAIQIGDVTDCSANQYVSAVGANLALSCAQPDHGGLTGLTDDDHTQYALLAGRSGGQTLIGGTAASNDLTLQATSNATKGQITLDDQVDIWPSIPDATAASRAIDFSSDYAVSGVAVIHSLMNSRPTVHVGAASGLLGGFAVVSSSGMVIAHDNATATPSGVLLFYADHTLRTTVAAAAPESVSFYDHTTVQGSGSITVPSSSGHRSFYANPIISAVDSATATYSAVTMYDALPRVGTDNGASTDGTAVTVTTLKGFNYADVFIDGGTGTETVATQVGVDIGALANGGTNIGLRNASTSVFTPTTQAIAAATDTITCNTTFKKFTTFTGTNALTSNPSIADGQTGQICILENVDATGTDCITLTDSTKGMQLSGNFTLCPNDTIILIYDGTDWIELSEMDN